MSDKDSFYSWYTEDDYDILNFPEDAMQEAWNAGRAEQAKRIEELVRNLVESCANLNDLAKKNYQQYQALRAKVEAHNEKAFLDCEFSLCPGSTASCSECINLINIGDSNE